MLEVRTRVLFLIAAHTEEEAGRTRYFAAASMNSSVPTLLLYNAAFSGI